MLTKVKVSCIFIKVKIMKDTTPAFNFSTLSNKWFNYTRTQNVRYKSHVNLETEIVFVTQGQLVMEIENERYVIEKNQGVYVLPFETHSFSSTDSMSHILMLDRRVATDFYDFIEDKTPCNRLFNLTDAHVNLVNYLTKNGEHEYDLLTAQALASPLIALIVEQCSFKKEKSIKSKVFYSALKVINEKFFYGFTLEDVAKEIGCHPVTLSKEFSASAGMSFSAYLTLRKCFYAKNLLEQTSMAVTDIALESGFGSLRNFNRVFKKHFYKTPTEYRQSITKKLDR